MALDIAMSNIAFDLDGVLIPDCDHFPNVGGLQEFYALTHYMRPLFKPNNEWSIITARPPRYRPLTMDWINKHFDNKPIRVWHEIIDQTPAEYKADIINQNDIEYYIESDIEIVKYLLDNTQAMVIHFDTFCQQQFKF